ncbi:pentatricopeptide repeat-containing protein [Salix suchowensis]|nr:pentatricopeptide repeat-containing protein [Salix suchowensis]
MIRVSIRILKNSKTFASNEQNHTLTNNLVPSSSSSSSSLQTIQNPNSISLSNPLYNFLPENQNPNNIVNLIYSSLKQDMTHLTLLQNDDIKGLIHHLGANEISRVLLRCQSDSVSALTFFNWVKNDLGLKPSTRNYCLILHVLAWSKEYEQAMKFLIELILLGKDPDEDVFQCLFLCCQDCNWDPIIFDLLLKAYVKVDMIKEGLRTFMQILEVGYVPSVIACNYLLNGLLKSNHIHLCWHVYGEMGRVGVIPNSYTFNILTHAFCKDGDIDKMNDFLEKMEEEGFEPDIVTYNTLINSYCGRGRLSDAFYLYRIMYRRCVLPDLVSYTALMNGLCKEGRVREAHQLFHTMVHRGLNPDVVSYNTLISGYCKEGKMLESKSLLYEMIGNGIFPDSFTCRVLIQGYRNEGWLISALNLVVELEKFGVSISPDIYNYLIASLCEEDRPFAAKTLLERMSQRGYIPRVEIYNKLIESLCKSDCVADALTLKAEIVAGKTNPNLLTYKALIRCLCRMGRSMEAEKAMIHGYCREKDAGRAESLLVLFAKEFHIFDSESYSTVVRIVCEDGDVAKFMELQEQMLKVGFAPNSLTCKYMIDGLRKNVGLVKEKRILE